MLNNYGESGGGFNNNSHGQTLRPTETQKQQNISSTWGYNGQFEGMYYGGEHQAMFMGPPYEGGAKHSNYSQYPSGSIHQPVPTPVVKCQEACCQHFQDRYPLNPAPLRYQPPVQPRYDGDYRRSVQPLSRKKVYSGENGYPGIPERHFSQYMGRGQLMTDSRQQMQMMRSQYPIYPPYWGGPRGWTGPRMNCPPPSYHQSVSQGAPLQTGLKMSDAHYMDASTQKPTNAQHRRVTVGGGGTDVIRPVPEPKRPTLDPNLQSCYEFGYSTGFVPFSEVNKIQSGSLASQTNSSTCRIPTDKPYHPHQMQYQLQSSDRNMMNCSNSINDLSYPMNFPMPGNDSHLKPGLEDSQQISDVRKLSVQYDPPLGKKRPDLDLRQYLATWEDDEEENTRLSEPISLGNNGAPFIVVDCRSLEGEAAAKLQERFKTPAVAQNCSSKRSSSPNSERKTDDQPRQEENTERPSLPSEFQSQASYAPQSMPTLLSDSEKNINYWNGSNSRDTEGIIGKGGAFQPLDCSKRDSNMDSISGKRDGHPENDLSTHKLSSANESSSMSFDALVSYYGDNRRIVDGGYDFVEMTERLVNTSEKPSTNNRTSLDHPLSTEISRPCDPRLQQSQLGNNPSIYNKVTPRYPTSSYQHYKSVMPTDPYYNYKHTNKYFGYENSQIIDPNYDYHKMPPDFENTRLYGNKEMSKDPRRMYHQEIDKSVESAFLDPMRKAQMDCFQDKSLEFGAVDQDQFITPIIMKNSDQTNRDKGYPEKNSAIRDRMTIINNENQTHPEKTVLITSQNGPPEIFRVPYSPEKDPSDKDNIVTLHSGDQTKSNTITVEVPYDQQYSTLVKLSEEMSRSENSDLNNKNKPNSTVSTTEVTHEEFKKPTSFKLKRLPNSKEWTVEGKECNDPNKRSLSESNTENAESSCDVSDERDSLKPSVTVSNLNMPSLDDIRDEVDNCEAIDDQSKSQLNDSVLCTNKGVCDDISKTKCNAQPPQMAIVQPMKLIQSEPELIGTSPNSNLPDKKDIDDQIQQPLNSQSSVELNFNSEKSPNGVSHLELISDSDISKHDNFRTHKKIQNSFSSGLPNCLTSPSEDFLHSSSISSGGTKDNYSPFHVYSDCDMNTQITDYFKMDERTDSGEKTLDTRIPSSPGVEAMFEDINHANQNQLYPSKNCNFQDLTDQNMTSLSAHNAHFQSFSNIFSEEDDDKRGKSNGSSVLQIGDKKFLKHLLDDIEDQHISDCSEEHGHSLNEILHEKAEGAKTSPPIPPISLKLNETKQIWCIAKKEKEKAQNHSQVNTPTDLVLKSTISTHSSQETASEFRGDVASTTDIHAASSGLLEIEKANLNEIPIEYSLHHFKSIQATEPSLPVDDQSLNETEPPSKNNIATPVDPTSTNQCFTITKFYPQIKILKKIAIQNNIINPKLGILVFDENGTHFPDQIEVSESLELAQSLVDSILEKTDDFIYLREKNSSGQSSGDSLYHHYNENKITKTNEDSFKAQSNSNTVIKFDSSNNCSTAKKEQESSIVKTTEIFIQREKENCQHLSVIKTTQLHDSNGKLKQTRKTSRSIFSPMSDDGFEDSTFSKKRKSLLHGDQLEDTMIFDILNNDSDNEEKNKIVENEAQVLDYSSKKCSKDLKELTMNRMTDEDFKGFGSPKAVYSQNMFSDPVNEIAVTKDIKDNTCLDHDLEKEHNIMKDSFEIDNALELMGLSSTKQTETAIDKISIDNKAKESSVSVQEALENEPDWFSCQDDRYISLQQEESISPNNVTSDNKDKSQVDEECRENSFCETISNCDRNIQRNETSSPVRTQTNKNHSIFPKAQEQAEDLCQTPISKSHLTKDALIGFVNENEDLNFSQDMGSPYDLSVENCSQTEGIDSLTQPQAYFSPELGATFNKEESLDAWPITGTGLLSSTSSIKDSQTDPSIEDFETETRLETSVIVRNNNCSSVINHQSHESCTTVYKNSDQYIISLHNRPFIHHSKSLNNETGTTLCPKQDFQNDTVHPATFHQKQSTKEHPVNCSDTILEESKLLSNCFENESDNLKMDCQINTLENTPKAFDTSTELKIEDSVNRHKMIYNHTSVITSNEINTSDSMDTCESVRENVENKCYCAGETVFMSFDEEAKSYLENSKSSYFHEFKKRKWQKFCKSLLVKDSRNLHPLESKREIIRTVVNSNEHFHYKPEKLFSEPLNEINGDTKETKNNSSPVSVEMDSGIEDESHLQYSDLSLKDQRFLSKYPSNPKETFSQINYEYENVKRITFESTDDLTVEGKTTLVTSTDKEFSTPLKDKSQIFMSKDSRIFRMRRDSFKMLEPESVLKEIFSPDPETDDSESKENECPGNFPQIKNDIPLQTLETTNLMTDSSLSSLPILSAKYNKLNESTASSGNSSIGILNTNDFEKVKHTQCNSNESETINESDGRNFSQRINHLSNSIVPTIHDKPLFSYDANGSLQATDQVSLTLSLQKPKVAIQESGVEEKGLTCSQNPSKSHGDLEIIGIEKVKSLSLPTGKLEKLTQRTSNEDIQDSNISNEVLNNIKDSQTNDNNNSDNIALVTSKLSTCQETIISKNSFEQSISLENETLSQKFLESGNLLENAEEKRPIIQDSTNFNGSVNTTQNTHIISSCDDPQTGIISSLEGNQPPLPCKKTWKINTLTQLQSTQHCDEINSALDTDKADCSGLQKTGFKTILRLHHDHSKKSVLQDSQTQPIGKLYNIQYSKSKNNENLVQIDDPEKGNKQLLVVSEKNVLMSTESFEDDPKQKEHFNEYSKEDSEQCGVGEQLQKDIACQNEKVSSVQDSLRNTVNNETFPLQCLVEAALALENVDSKQALLSNSSFSGLYCQTEDNSLKFSENNISESTNKNYVEEIKVTNHNNSTLSGEHVFKKSILTSNDQGIFSKFEETNYNLRASTRIVTSSSSNIIPYSKRRYGLKSSKINTSKEIKKKKSEASVSEKGSRTKKRRGGFTYPRSKRRKKITKEKQNCQQVPPKVNFSEVVSKTSECNTADLELLQSCQENAIELNKEAGNNHTSEPQNKVSANVSKCSLINTNYDSHQSTSKSGFGGPLIIASNNCSTPGNIFCVHVNSNKMDEYVNNLNLGELEVMSESNQTYKENNSGIVPDVTLENGTSLVIIIEELDDTDKTQYGERSKGESDIILNSIEGNCTVHGLNQSISILDDCSDMLNTEFSVNESCICPPEFNDHSQNPLLIGKQNEILGNEQFMGNSAFEMNDNTEDGYERFSATYSQDLTANCYEEINENLVNGIGNWPFVEEEVAEFENNNPDLSNKIPEEGRKIELKCSLPWKKIFNMSKTKKKRNKMSRKVSGLELGPAKVEVRLKAPSSEWKVINDYHENDSSVVKVSRLILQRDSDNSSHSEKDSEEENENKRNSVIEGSEESESRSSSDHSSGNNVPCDENWQPVVILTRNKELDELMSMESKEHSEKMPSPSSIENINSDNSERDYSSEFASESDTSELLNPVEHINLYSPRSRESSSCNENLDSTTVHEQEHSSKYSYYPSGKPVRVQGYETYSPSACNNELTEENLYSPSDPHFSPDAGYLYSEKSYCGYEGDGVASNSEEEGSVKTSCYTNENLKNYDVEEERKNPHECNDQSILTNDNETSGISDTLPQNSSLSDVCSPRYSLMNGAFQFATNLPVTNDTDILQYAENSISESNEVTLPGNDLQQKSSSESNKVTLPGNDLQLNVSKRVDNETKTYEPSADVIEPKKKSKRKMPKNFFVRKKLNKKNNNLENIIEKPCSIEDDTHKAEDEVAYDSVLQRLSNTPCSTSDLRRRHSLSSLNENQPVGSVSDMSSVCENSRLQCVYDLEDSSPVRQNESPRTERFEEKVRLRDGGRGLKRPCEGHSKEDTKRRRKKFKKHSSTCEECGIYFENKEELTRHNAHKHVKQRELHHCLLCQRSFSSAARHSMHVQGRSHRHLELTQRHTMHSMHRLLVGGDCPQVAPLSHAELHTLQWRPAQSGYTHFYHELTPLQAVLQENNSGTSEDMLSENQTPND